MVATADGLTDLMRSALAQGGIQGLSREHLIIAFVLTLLTFCKAIQGKEISSTKFIDGPGHLVLNFLRIEDRHGFEV